MALESMIATIFDLFLADREATVSPSAFVRWVHENRPDIAQVVRDQALLAHAQRYCERWPGQGAA